MAFVKLLATSLALSGTQAVHMGTQEDASLQSTSKAWAIKRTPQDPASLVEAPEGTAKGLFVPALHECDEKQRTALLEGFPKEAEITPRVKSIELGLKTLNDVFASEDVPTILESGSMLGFYRQCHAIPGDLDGDVAVFGHWLQDGKFERLQKKFKEVGGDFHKDLCPDGIGVSGCQLRVVFDDKKFYPERFHVDVFVYGQTKPCKEAPCVFNTIIWPGGGLNEEREFAQCDNSPGHFEQASFLGKTFWMTVPAASYLERLYGKEWDHPGGASYEHCDFDHKVHAAPMTLPSETVPSGSFILDLQKNAKTI